MPYKVYQTQAVDPKVEPGTTTEVEMTEAGNGTNGNSSDNNGTEKTKSLPPWLSKMKEVGGIKKVPKTVLKRRRNFKLKRMLVPKSPSMLLYEVIGTNEVTFGGFEIDKVDKLIKIEATYDGKTFRGVGPNKSVAKNICAEQVLQHFVFKSCTKPKSEDGDVDMEAEGGGAGAREDPTPWTALASLGLFKLFNDWQSQGVQLPPELLMGPAMRTMAAQSSSHPEAVGGAAAPFAANAAGAPVPGKAAAKREKKPKEHKPKVLPENAHSHHPVQLLNEMCGQLEYECVAEGVIPNVIFKMTVNVNGADFIGVSKIKKEAKKLAAQAAMTAIYNVQYPTV